MVVVTDTATIMIGCDIGQKHDPTAIVVVELCRRPTGRTFTILGADRIRRVVPATEAASEVRHMERLILGTGYPAVAERVAAVVAGVNARYPTGHVQTTLIVDATGVGQPVVDILRQALRGARVRLSAATFTHGDRLDGKPGDAEIRVGKAFLVSRLQALMQTDRIALPAQHPEAAAMARELADYEIKVDDNAHGHLRRVSGWHPR